MLVKLTSARFGHNTKTMPGGQIAIVGMFGNAAGDEVEMNDDEARRYIAKGLAVEVNKQNRK